ncbi:transcription initiation protein [Paenibacillus helianthi]|uniref:Transcription initiation protein n=1 Tax=Paenibacillus helianthi TaxID=1349432 RepID=A0ABX3EUS4_9BACL|nr:YciI family protein [Paenibacillus helianthi]OKP88153.1 transcription initiation protein [Paenibacillus helianthi]
MNKFLLVFRMDITTPEAQPTPVQMQGYMEQWGEWISSLAAQDRLAAGGNHLSAEGRVLRPHGITTDGPYTEHKESMAGYILVNAVDMEEAVQLAKGCPILLGEGTSVEVRPVAGM